VSILRIFRPHIVIGFLALLVILIGHLHAAPLENGFALAPKASASPAEKDAAYYEARSRVLSTAAKYEHTPYRPGGIDRKGLDCSGFVYLSFREALGISIPRSSDGLYSWAEKISIEKAQPGDLVFFHTTGNGKISHVGIYVGEGRFIHAASEGPDTGVIYSRLDERYWSRNYAGSGRALPASNAGGSTGDTHITTASTTTPVKEQAKKQKPERTERTRGNLLVGVAAAPTWNTLYPGGNIVRGAAGQFRIGTEINPFGYSMLIGVELRPEWDGGLGVFRLPLTFSWGLNDKLRIFAGPALSFGNASLSTSGENRYYTGGTSWLGAAGITVAPVAFKVTSGEIAPYGELAWQSYMSKGANKNFGYDFAAGLRLSTGIRYTWQK
jgi:probable lipoprotein NlpC